MDCSKPGRQHHNTTTTQHHNITTPQHHNTTRARCENNRTAGPLLLAVQLILFSLTGNGFIFNACNLIKVIKGWGVSSEKSTCTRKCVLINKQNSIWKREQKKNKKPTPLISGRNVRGKSICKGIKETLSAFAHCFRALLKKTNYFSEGVEGGVNKVLC